LPRLIDYRPTGQDVAVGSACRTGGFGYLPAVVGGRRGARGFATAGRGRGVRVRRPRFGGDGGGGGVHRGIFPARPSAGRGWQ